jgi:hypothetical protein
MDIGQFWSIEASFQLLIGLLVGFLGFCLSFGVIFKNIY